MPDRDEDLARLRQTRQALAAARGRGKLDVILDAPDPPALVRGLPAQDLYFAVEEIGRSDAAPLVQMARPAQFRTFVDLDAWQGGELRADRVAAWLDLARGEDDAAFREKLEKLDIEVLELVLRAVVQLWDLEEEEPPDITGPSERSPDGRYLLVYREDAVDFAGARRLLADLYARDPFEASRLLSAVRWELESELTETALRWRDARLADLGFPTPDEAASLYARAPRTAPARAAPPEQPAGFFLQQLRRDSLLDRALDALPASARERLERELVAVLNMAIVADAVDVSDLDAVRAEAAAVRDTVALGLAVIGGDPAAALGGRPLKAIFQAGFTATLELRWRLDRLLASLPLRAQGQIVADDPGAATAHALLERRPRFSAGGATPRPFATSDDLAAASLALDRIEAEGGLLAAAGWRPERAPQPVPSTTGILATALARHALGRDPAAGALARSEIPAAREALLEEGAGPRRVRDAPAAWLREIAEGVGGAAGEVVDGVLAAVAAAPDDVLLTEP